MMGLKLAFGVALCASLTAGAQGERTVCALNGGWQGVLRSTKGDVVRRVDDIALPHNWDDYHGFRHLAHGNQHGSATYSRSFTVDPKTGERRFLVFDGAGSFLTVRVNGRAICERRPAGRIVTTLEVTDVVRDGTNRIETICDHPEDVVDFPWQCGGCGNCTCESPEPFGLFRGVSLVTTGPVRIAPFSLHVWHDEDMERGFAEAVLDGGGRGLNGLSVRFSCKEAGTSVVVPCDKDGRGLCSFDLKCFERWSLEYPRLYTFVAEVTDAEGRIIDVDTVETGFATVRWPLDGATDPRFFLNGEPTFVHGTSEIDHRFGGSLAFEPEEIDARCRELKKLGFNMMREGHEPHDLRYMRNLERMGILYWTGFSTHIYVDTPEFRKNFLFLLEQWVKERRNSPALAIWGLQNESTLPFEFARECVARIRELDPLCSPKSRPVVTCNFGSGTDWNVIQNWSGTYRGVGGDDLMEYGADLSQPDQLLNGEYGAWRLAGWHSDPDEPFEQKGPWTEEHHARILFEKLIRAWKVRDKVCGHLQWPFFTHENPGRSVSVDEGYREIDKIGPVNFKGIYTIYGGRTAAWYVYFAYGRHLRAGDMDAVAGKPLSWWIAEGKRLAEPNVAESLDLTAEADRVYLHRMNCGGDAVTDSAGNIWSADDSRYASSWSQATDLAVEGYRLNPVLASQGVVEGRVVNAIDADQDLFRTFRYGRERLVFRFPAPTNAVCRVEMYFVEPGSYGRVFDIAINGVAVVTNFTLADVIHERNAIVRTWTVNTGTNAEVAITFPRVAANQAVVSAIAVSTDASAAERLPRETRPVGYPECAGLTWRELSARVSHKTPKETLPNGGKSDKVASNRIEPIPVPDKDGFHWVYFNPFVAGDYAVRFKVVGSEALGKEVRWRLQDWQLKGVIAEGKSIISRLDPDGFFSLPLNVFINAGGFCFFYQSDDDVLSVRNMVNANQ